MAESERARRVGGEIRRELGALMQRELRDPRLRRVGITVVRVSADLGHARVYCTLSAAGEEADAQTVAESLALLGRAAGFLRTRLGRAIRLYRIPALRFIHDESIERGSRIDRLLRQAGDGAAALPPCAEPPAATERPHG